MLSTTELKDANGFLDTPWRNSWQGDSVYHELIVIVNSSIERLPVEDSLGAQEVIIGLMKVNLSHDTQSSG